MTDSRKVASTLLLHRALQRDEAAASELVKLLYDDLRALAAVQLSREPTGITLDPTALVHEAFLRLIDQKQVQWQGRTHFLAVGAQAMRRVLVDHARGKKRAKRGGGWHRVRSPQELTISANNEDDVLAVHDALCELAKLDARQALIVELRFFGGMTAAEVADYLGVSKPTVDRQWRTARAWLRRQLSEEQPS